MRVTVCQLSDEARAFEADWANLAAHVGRERSDLVLLPEMPFAPWFAAGRAFDQDLWDEAVALHARWKQRLSDLHPATVLSTEPLERNRNRLNEAFVWTGGRASPAHQKRYLPEESGFWEASWYARGDGSFDLANAAGASVGFQICTELWMLEVSRQYGRAGADIIASPRCTPLSSVERWLVAGRAAAILAGAFCLSSNHSGMSRAGFEFGGAGWIIDPDGTVLATTSAAQPIVTRDIDLSVAREAKNTYPRYVD